MSDKVSPLAPSSFATLPPISGVRLASVEAGIKYKGRKDLCVISFEGPAIAAGVFTKSMCPSAPVDWCRKILANGTAKCVVVNSGNANAFTGMKGMKAVQQTVDHAVSVFGCAENEVFLASTGVIGEPLEASNFGKHLTAAKAQLSEDGWLGAANAIMTTDTFAKLASERFEVDGRTFTINGIAKGSGMIAPDMATMLAFIVTDAPIEKITLQSALATAVEGSFNSITVDSDTSTSDTVLLFSTGGTSKPLDGDGLKQFQSALIRLSKNLALQIIRDGEGASKQIEVTVKGATSKEAAKAIAFSIANSPLVKTAIAGEDANWGRIVMAVGKAGQLAERDKLEIAFNGLVVAKEGERAEGYSEEEASQAMKSDEIVISVDLHLGKYHATVWTCDLTKEYIAINADYRS